MATVSEMMDLLSKLARRLRSAAGEDFLSSELIDPSISELCGSLNLSRVSGVSVLDTALSLMCFKAPQVFDATIHYMVNTITAVLSSSISCKPLGLENGVVLPIGSSISPEDCFRLIKFVADTIPRLESHGVPWDSLLWAVVRIAAFSSSYRCLPSLRFTLDLRSVEERSNGISQLLQHFPRAGSLTLKDHEVPLRLLIWHLDPLTLRHDISAILQESVERPFLCLTKEFQERMDWRSIVLCLVLSPLMFINSRALLHDWFLLTGLISILELLAELISVMLDIITRPTWWGISMGLSLNLPFLYAYFPCWNRMSRTLAGPLSCEIFLQLVDDVGKKVNHVRRQLFPNIEPFAAKLMSVDHKSIWALAINFPDWFYFASVLLFSDNGYRENSSSGWTFLVPKIGQTNCSNPDLASSAARYIAWILSPVDKHHEDQLFDGFTKISLSWTSNQTDSDPFQIATSDCDKKIKKPKFSYNTNKFNKTDKYDSRFICSFLKDFQRMLMAGEEAVEYPGQAEAKSSLHVSRHNLLLRRIPLGIVIGCHRDITEDGCGQLLHFAATGRILHPQMSNDTTMKHGKSGFGGLNVGAVDNDGWSEKDAAAGVCLVFSWTDIVERMTTTLCETEEIGIEIICRFKLRASRYLFECIKKLIQVRRDTDEDRQMLIDISYRLELWKNQGKEIVQLRDSLDNAMEGLRSNLSSI